jgi:hypothetical protein
VVWECFGIYCLLLAIPVTIVSVTGNDAASWFVAAVTLIALVGYQLSGASLLSHYLTQHVSTWRRAVISAIGGAFTALLVGLGAWLFGTAVYGSDAPLLPAFVIVGFLAVAGAYAIWAEPLPGAPTPPSTPGRPAQARPLAAVTGPPAQPGLPTNAPPWAVAQAARQERPPQSERPIVSWLLALLTLLLVIATLVLVAVTLHDQRNANAQTVAAVKQGQSAALSSIAALEGQTLRAQRAAAVTSGELTARVFVTRVRLALAGLLAVLRSNRELLPTVPLADLSVSVPSGVSLLRTNVGNNVLGDLSAFFGQMRITYGNFDFTRKHRRLTRSDHASVCRTIRLGNKALLGFRGVPRAGVSRHAHAALPKECK